MGAMSTENGHSTFLKYPSAYLPIAMSLAALLIVVVHVAVYGAGHEVDEGAAAHLFQLLMVGQVPIVGFFALRRLRRETRPALTILAWQLAAAITALSPVHFLHL